MSLGHHIWVEAVGISGASAYNLRLYGKSTRRHGRLEIVSRTNARMIWVVSSESTGLISENRVTCKSRGVCDALFFPLFLSAEGKHKVVFDAVVLELHVPALRIKK